MAAIMFDSDDPQALLTDHCRGCRVATYADLVTPDLVRQLAGRLVVIDRGQGDPLKLATVADIEQGLLTIEQGADLIAQWTSERRPDPTAYHDRAVWDQVSAACKPLEPWHWVATLDGTADPLGRYPGIVQVLDSAKLGFHADLSIVWDDRWHPVPPGLPGSMQHQLRQLSGALTADASALAVLISRL